MVPENGVFFTAGNEILFNQSAGVLAKMCLPGMTEVEIWLQLEVWQNGGSNLHHIRILDFNTMKVYAEAKMNENKATEKTFSLYWRGMLPGGFPELTVQYFATQRFPLAQSKPNGFFYGYKIMNPSYAEVRVKDPTPCLE